MRGAVKEEEMTPQVERQGEDSRLETISQATTLQRFCLSILLNRTTLFKSIGAIHKANAGKDEESGLRAL